MGLSLWGRVVPAALLMGIGATLSLLPARANMTLSVSPSLVEISATPGGVGVQELTVFNEGTEAFGVTASVQQYKDGDGDRSAVAWLRVEPQSFDLAPGEQRPLKVTISVPAGLPPGGRYAMVGVRTGPRGGEGSQVAVAGQLGVPFLINVQDPAQGSASLVYRGSLDRVLPVLGADGRLGIRALLANRGNVHLVPRGRAELITADGGAAGRLDIPETTAVLPGSQAMLEAEGTLPFVEGAGYRLRASVDYRGASPATVEASFTARAGLAIEKLEAQENSDRGPILRAALRNEGELALLPRLQFAVRNQEGRVLNTARPSQPPLLEPNQGAQVEVQYPGRLAAGEYTLLARAEYGQDRGVQKEAVFRIGTPPPTLSTAWPQAPAQAAAPDPAVAQVGMPVWVAPATGVATLVLLLAAVLWLPPLGNLRRRLQRALRALREDE